MDRRVDVRHVVHRRSCDISSSNMAAYERWPRVSARGESIIVKPVGEVICIRKFPNFSDDTLTNQMLPRPCGPWRRARPLRTLRVGVRKRLVHVSNL